MFIDDNPILYANFIQVIKRKSALFLENDENGLFIQDTVSNAFMLACNDYHLAIKWLKKHEHLHYQLIVVYDKKLVSFIKKRYNLHDSLICFQEAYLSQNELIENHDLVLKLASIDDLSMILKHYHRLSIEEIKEIIDEKHLYLGYVDDHLIGFIGEHLEGSIGLLEVFEDYRRLGYGSELEKRMINLMLKRNLLPFCQIEVDNVKSLSLQKKLGMSLSQEKVYWLF